MKWISTIIKKKWMDKILSGEKTSEYKVSSNFWGKRIENLADNLTFDRTSDPNHHRFIAKDISINFLCGRKSYKYKVTEIIRHFTPMMIDGVSCNKYIEIKLGDSFVVSSDGE